MFFPFLHLNYQSNQPSTEVEKNRLLLKNRYFYTFNIGSLLIPGYFNDFLSLSNCFILSFPR